MPKWDKVLYKTSNKAGRGTNQNTTGTLNLSNAPTNTPTSSQNQGVFFIPLQSQNSQDVKSYITAYKHSDSLYTYRLYNRDSLNALQPSSNLSQNNLFLTQAVFGYFEKTINNVDSINIASPANATIKDVNINFDTSSSQSNGNTNIKTPTSSSGGCDVTITVTP